MQSHTVVSREEWIESRKALLTEEKAFNKERDRLAAARRALPWVRVDKDYTFEGEGGRETLSDLFAGRSQLIVYHFMFGETWEEGCPSCSFIAENFDGSAVHLAHRDVTFVVASRAPLASLLAYRKRLGWSFKWVSSLGSEFNYDFHVSFRPEELASGEVEYNYHKTQFPSDEAPGLSVFHKDGDGGIFHTYSTYARGLDPMISTYQYLDLVPKGRDEGDLPWTMAWLRRNDQYED